MEHASRAPVPVRDALLAVEVLSPSSTFRPGAHTDEVFTTERPRKVTLDLPALTARRDRAPERRQA